VSHYPAERDRPAAVFGHPGVAGAYRHRPLESYMEQFHSTASLAWSRPPV